MNKFKKIKNIIYIFLIILIIGSSIYIIKYYYDMSNAKKQTKLLDNISLNENKIENEENEPITVNQENVAPSKTERMLKLEELQKENSDIVAWLEIEGTKINYPVLQGKDNSYYMTHDYQKKYSSNGSVFLDKDYSWSIPSANLLIYGHNMKVFIKIILT